MIDYTFASFVTIAWYSIWRLMCLKEQYYLHQRRRCVDICAWIAGRGFDIGRNLFPGRVQVAKFLPKVFKTIKIWCIVDCTEFRVECSWNFARQGSTFSSYKHIQVPYCCDPKWWGMLCFGFVWGGYWWCRNLQRKWVGKTPETVWPGIGWSWFYCGGAVKSSSSGTENSIISKR